MKAKHKFFFFFDGKTKIFIKIWMKLLHHGLELALESKDSLGSKQ